MFSSPTIVLRTSDNIKRNRVGILSSEVVFSNVVLIFCDVSPWNRKRESTDDLILHKGDVSPKSKWPHTSLRGQALWVRNKFCNGGASKYTGGEGWGIPIVRADQSDFHVNANTLLPSEAELRSVYGHVHPGASICEISFPSDIGLPMGLCRSFGRLMVSANTYQKATASDEERANGKAKSKFFNPMLPFPRRCANTARSAISTPPSPLPT
jgi:hypothetical protein